MTDRTLADALFLAAHPAWSQRDLDGTEQDVVDLLSAVQAEGAKHGRSRDLQSQRESRAAVHRSKLGYH